MISALKHDPQMLQLGFDYKTYIHEGTGKYWKESIEHRDNYSMGQGNYLKATTRYGSGWEVRSRNLAWKGYDGDTVEVAPSVSR